MTVVFMGARGVLLIAAGPRRRVAGDRALVKQRGRA